MSLADRVNVTYWHSIDSLYSRINYSRGMISVMRKTSVCHDTLSLYIFYVSTSRPWPLFSGVRFLELLPDFVPNYHKIPVKLIIMLWILSFVFDCLLSSDLTDVKLKQYPTTTSSYWRARVSGRPLLCLVTQLNTPPWVRNDCMEYQASIPRYSEPQTIAQ